MAEATATAPTNPADRQLAEAPVAVNGWDLDCVEADSPTPPVVVNPAASTLDLIDWARGQLEQAAHITGEALYGTDLSGRQTKQLAGAAHHFNLQALAVLKALSARLGREDAQHA